MAPLKDCLIHWKKKLERGLDDQKILEIIGKLYKVPITVDLLKETRIGKVIKQLGKQPGQVGQYASTVLSRWRDIVEHSESMLDSQSSMQEKSSNGKYKRHNGVSHGIIATKQDKPRHQGEKCSYKLDSSCNGVSNGLNLPEKSKSHSTKNGYKLQMNEDSCEEAEKYENGFVNGTYDDGSGSENGTSHSTEFEEAIPDYPKCTNGYNKYHNGASANRLENEYDPEYPSLSHKKVKLNSDIYHSKSPSKETFPSHSSSKKRTPHENIDCVNMKKPHKTDGKKLQEVSKIHSSKSSSSDNHHHHHITKKEKHHDHKHSKDISTLKKRSHDAIEHEQPKNSFQNGFLSSENSYDKCKIMKGNSEVDYNAKTKHKTVKMERPGKSFEIPQENPSIENKNNLVTKSSSKHSKVKCEEATKPEKNKPVSKDKSPAKVKVTQAEELTASEASFEDCLGLNDVVFNKKKKISPSKCKPSTHKEELHVKKHKEKKSKPHVSSKEKHKSLKENSKPMKHTAKSIPDAPVKEVIDLPKPPPLEKIDIVSTLPEIQPNYKPLRRIDFDFVPTKKKALSNEEAIIFTTSKKDRTAVYSGRRNLYASGVPSLYELCTRVLIDKVDYIGYTGGVPFYLLKPVLERCSPAQLYKLEDFNPYLLTDTQELWERHCLRDFRIAKREEGETFREMYLRCFEEKERKLKALTANISASMSKSNPVRQVKLAYVDSVVKPPRDVAKKQARHGTALPVNHSVKAGPPSKSSPRPTAPIINATIASIKTPAQITLKKPKVAPLMAKTLKSMKKIFRR